MKKLATRFPQIEFKELFAPADYTKASLNGVFQSLFEGVLLTASCSCCSCTLGATPSS